MFISCGIWGAFAAILPPKVAVGGALTTGALLFLAVAMLGFLVSHHADECHDETMLRIYGGHIVRVPNSPEEV